MLDAGKFFKKKDEVPEQGEPDLKSHSGKILEIPIEMILPNPSQPRKVFDQEGLEELCHSIKEFGIIQPVVVRIIDNGYELIVGERRLRAAKLAGLEAVPAIINEKNSGDQQILALIENIHRSDLTSIEEALSFQQILQSSDLTQAKLAERLGRSQSAIANKLRLLRLHEDVRQLLLERKLGERQARALVLLPEKDQVGLATLAVKEGLSGMDLEKKAKSILKKAEAGVTEKPGSRKASKSYSMPFDGPDGPTGELLNQLSSIVDKGRKKGVPVLMKVRELARNELMVEIKVDLKEY